MPQWTSRPVPEIKEVSSKAVAITHDAGTGSGAAAPGPAALSGRNGEPVCHGVHMELGVVLSVFPEDGHRNTVTVRWPCQLDQGLT